MTTPAQSASVTAARMRSVRRFCITYDFDSVEDGCVTVRDRDTMEQKRIPVSELKAHIAEAVKF